jgi:hypothetical protein
VKRSPAPGTPSTSRNGTADRGGRASFLLALTLLWTSGHAAAPEPVAAVWKEREFDFTYRSSVAVFSCSTLKGRIATILHALGARPDLKIRLGNCDQSSVPAGARVNDPVTRNAWDAAPQPIHAQRTDPRQSVNVYVRLFMPTEVTPDVLVELQRDRSRRELVSHMTGNPAAKFNDPVAFMAQWQPVTLSRETINLDPAECELLDQMSANDFGGLGIRVVHRDYSCDPNRVSHISPQLDVEAFLVATSDTSHGQPSPATGGGDADPSAPPASDQKPAEPATDKSQ